MYVLGVLTGIALCCLIVVLEVLLIKFRGKTAVSALYGVVEGIGKEKKGQIIENPTLEALSIEEWAETLPAD